MPVDENGRIIVPDFIKHPNILEAFIDKVSEEKSSESRSIRDKIDYYMQNNNIADDSTQDSSKDFKFDLELDSIDDNMDDIFDIDEYIGDDFVFFD